MIDGKKLLAIIPARGGSKRLPGKNLLKLAGKPMIAWSIEAAHKSKYIDRIVVSTDDNEIALVSEKLGAEVPFIRPSLLATDSTSSLSVVKHTLEELAKNNEFYDYIILLQPTSPLRSEKHIDQAVQLLIDKCANAIISVSEVDYPIEWVGSLPNDFSMGEFYSNNLKGKSGQKYNARYRLNGAIYLCLVEKILSENTFLFSDKAYAYVMSKENSIDIDDEFDYKIAIMLKCKSKK